MKIALLNLPFDSNYGGNLQRYALITILQRNGYDVEHINLRFNYKLPWYKVPFSFLKRIIKKLIFRDNNPILLEQQKIREINRRNKNAEIFYNQYIPHTKVINNKKELNRLPKYEAYIVGSDQVWRKSMTKAYGLNTYFFDFIKDDSSIKIAYGVSLGSEQNELLATEIQKLGQFYKKFSAVSVRENSALKMFQSYNWTSPQAIQVLDPTLLLSIEDYIKLINNGKTYHSPGEIFCYILDKNKEKEKIIHDTTNQLKLKPFFIDLERGDTSIEQWLRSFQDAKHVITDSFHGLVFSIIFNKPFTLIRNEKRGNARFDSILQTFNIPLNGQIDWGNINTKIIQEREKAMKFITQALENN